MNVRNRPLRPTGSRRLRRSILPLLEDLEPRLALSALTVTSATDSGTGSLRAEVALAQPGDTIQFARSLNGRTITLTGGPIEIGESIGIDGPGANKLTISAGGNGRAFVVDGGGTPAIDGVTITGGRVEAPDQGLAYAAGGAILVTSGQLQLADDVFTGDSVSYAAGLAEGGAVAAVGSGSGVSVMGTTFSGDEASGQSALGGGLSLQNGAGSVATGGAFNGDVVLATGFGEGGGIGVDGQLTLAVAGTTFADDAVQLLATDPDYFGSGGGAIASYGGSTATIRSAMFRDDLSMSAAVGGAIDAESLEFLTYALDGTFVNSAGGSLTATSTTFTGDQALGTNIALDGNTMYASGGAIFTNQTTLDLTDDTFSHDEAIAADGTPSLGQGGLAGGGAVYSVDNNATITGTTFDHDLVQGGTAARASGDAGANGDGGALYFVGYSGVSPINLTIAGSTFRDNQAVGGSGGSGAPGQAGGDGGQGDDSDLLIDDAAVTIGDTTFSGGRSVGGAGGAGGAGMPGGAGAGGVASVGEFSSSLAITGSSFTGHQSIGGSGGAGGSGAAGGAGGFANATIYAGIADPAAAGATIAITDSAFAGDTATGGAGGDGGDGGGAGGVGGPAYGAAIIDYTDIPMTITGTDIIRSDSVGGRGGNGGSGGVGGDGGLVRGGAIETVSTTSFGFVAPRTAALTLNQDNVSDDTATGGDGGDGTSGGDGGTAEGGGIVGGGATIDVAGSTIDGDSATGGAGGKARSGGTGGVGGAATGGGLYAVPEDGFASTVTVADSDVSSDVARGGAGAQGSDGGDGQGGGIYTSDTYEGVQGTASLTVTGATFFLYDEALAGAGGADSSDPPVGQGGGIYIDGAIVELSATVQFAHNKATTAGNDVFGPYTTTG